MTNKLVLTILRASFYLISAALFNFGFLSLFTLSNDWLRTADPFEIRDVNSGENMSCYGWQHNGKGNEKVSTVLCKAGQKVAARLYY